MEDTYSLYPKQKKVAKLLAEGVSGAEAARRVGVMASTDSHWRNRHPGFMNRVRMHQAEMYEMSSGKVLKIADASLIKLAQIIADKGTAPHTAVQAISICLQHQQRVLDHSLKQRQLEALESRLEAVESRQDDVIDVTPDQQKLPSS